LKEKFRNWVDEKTVFYSKSFLKIADFLEENLEIFITI